MSDHRMLRSGGGDDQCRGRQPVLYRGLCHAALCSTISSNTPRRSFKAECEQPPQAFRALRGRSLARSGRGRVFIGRNPNMSKLLERMCSAFFEHWQFDIEHERGSADKPPLKLSIAFADCRLHSDTARKLGSELASKDLLLAAQQIKNCIRDADLLWLLRRSLYGYGQYTPRSSHLLDSLAALCGPCDDAHVHQSFRTTTMICLSTP